MGLSITSRAIVGLAALSRFCYVTAQGVSIDDDDISGTNSSNLSADPWRPLSYPDFIICDRQYGEGLSVGPCQKAYDKLPIGLEISDFVTQHTHVADKSLKVPYYYTDVEEGSGIF